MFTDLQKRKMPRAEVSRLIDAAPAAVYGIIADYRVGHPAILPKPYFASLVVEKGGTGAGTAIRVDMEVMGQKQTLRMQVSEPEPGRVLVEEDPTAGVYTSFTVAPVDGGRQSRVTIATRWRPKPGLAGWVEGLINPLAARWLYKKELGLLADRAGGSR